MPTKHRRHAITETPRVKDALDPLRRELEEPRLDLGELLVLGAETKLAEIRADRSARAGRELAEMIRKGELDLRPELADEAKRAGLPE